MKNFELEIERLNLEIDRLKNSIMTQKKIQLKGKTTNKKSNWLKSINPTGLTAIIAALITFWGNHYAENIKYKSAQEVQEKQHQTALILEVTKNWDTKKAESLLKFFVETKLLYDKNIRAYLDKNGSIFETITAWDKSGILHPRLIMSWEANDSLDVWTIIIKPNVILSDGRMLTAEVLKQIIEKENIPNISKIEFVNIFYQLDDESNPKNLKVCDLRKLKIFLSEPDIQIMERLSAIEIAVKNKL